MNTIADKTKEHFLKRVENAVSAKGIIPPHEGVKPHYNITIRDEYFTCRESQSFDSVLKNYLPIALENYPNMFATKNTEDVVEAFYKVYETGDDSWMDKDLFYKYELLDCAITIENKDGLTLRIQAFEYSNGNEFIKGFIHAYKHFVVKGQPITTKSQENAPELPEYFISVIIEVFFFGKIEEIDGKFNIYSTVKGEPFTFGFNKVDSTFYLFNTAFKTSNSQISSSVDI